MREQDQSLAVQMANLSKKQAIRDQRRMEQRMRSAAERALDEGDQGHKSASGGRSSANATGGLSLGSSAAEAVAEAARLSESVMVYRCEVCNVSFKVEAQYRMHISGATHRKAVAKEEADRQRALRGGAAAEAALAAAGWQGRVGDGAAGVPSQAPAGYGAQGRGGQPRPGIGPGRGHPRGQVAAAPHRTHADVLHELQKQRETGPLDLDGWVPPSIPVQEPTKAIKAEVKTAAKVDQDAVKEERQVGPIGAGFESAIKIVTEEGTGEDNESSMDGALGGLLGAYADDSSSNSSSEDEDVEVPPGTSFF